MTMPAPVKLPQDSLVDLIVTFKDQFDKEQVVPLQFIESTAKFTDPI